LSFGASFIAPTLMNERRTTMLKIRPEIWTKNGGKQFVILSLRDFEKVQELIEDAGLSRILKEARRRNANSPTYTSAEVRKRLGLNRMRERKAG